MFAISFNVADIRSFHETQWSENLGEHLALAKREPDIVLLYDVCFSFYFLKENHFSARPISFIQCWRGARGG